MDHSTEQLWGEDDPELYADDESEDENKQMGRDDGMSNSKDEELTAGESTVFLPGDAIPDGETLEADPSAYVTLNEFTGEWPCLSFDILRDSLGENRSTFPMSSYLVAGTQAETAEQNSILVMKLSNIRQMQQDDSDEEDDDDDDELPVTFRYARIAHNGGVNRVSAAPQSGSVVATWADTADVQVWDITNQLAELDTDEPVTKGGKNPAPRKQSPLFSSKHTDEGYALSWSPVVPFRLATGDNAAEMRIWNHQEGGSWAVDVLSPPCTTFTSIETAHTAAIEDIAWSPNEQHVFASASSDKTLKIWDCRQKGKSRISIDAHSCDVNSISWNRCEQHLMVSGADDGSFCVWDLRTFGSAKTKRVEPVASFEWHGAPVTSVEWHPTDASVICVSGDDDQVTIWDLAVEEDSEVMEASVADREVPAQLLFIHQGQKSVKEAHWHRQLPGVIVSTAENGFNLFKTISVTQ